MNIQYPNLLRSILIIMMTTTFLTMQAQDDVGYRMPSKAIADLIDAPPTPSASLSPNYEWMLLLNRPSMPSIEEVAQEELRIAGIRINPKTNGSSRASHYNGMTLKSVAKGKDKKVTGLPENPRFQNVSWSSNGSKIAFTNTVSDGIELWMVDVATATAKKMTNDYVNDAMGGLPYRWFDGGKSLIYKAILTRRGMPPKASIKPQGPVIQNNEGNTAAVRTYQDLLKNQHDENLFDYYTTAQLKVLKLSDGSTSAFGEPGIIKGFSPSPDNQYIMISRIKKPYSYIVPYSRFPFTQVVYGAKGNPIRELANIPAAEDIPKGFGATREGARNFTWRADKAASVYWVEAQDGGDPRKEAEIRDQLFSLDAPFKGEPKKGISFKLRYGGVTWGDGGLAMSSEWWWQTRQRVMSSWSPDNPSAGKKVLFDRNWEDQYSDPGNFEMTQNEYGRYVLMTADGGKTLYLRGQGASPEGNRPFVDKMNLATKETTRLWRSEAPYYENPISIIDAEKGIVLTLRESNYEIPNFFMRDLNSGSNRQITNFVNPYAALKEIKKEFIKYKRKDGVELTGTLYTPPGYDKERDGRLPVVMWAYPQEFKSKSAAGQVTDSPYRFIRVGWYSPILWVMEGYAVLDDFGMPIIGEGKEEPNETFVEQLTTGAEAAIDKIVEMGVADRDRCAVGGHSYGAFMTANLMAHTDLFAAGIARSGAYNRTLTPFGFQSEERTFWEASDTYFKMSPFMHADKIKEPLLLVHGEADNNSGTYPMQSERFYSALKGHGTTTRLVMLPHESHGYRAKESVMHVAWETGQWLDKHVKNKKKDKAKP
ncbi:MAG: prolyl oligopeptidase family serine peptidase [Bacteroidetes bacterium]|jgi:dipeptidyl aminopeptidase/acylaminoacyl peptidase|nr:prolyl oligopeptidase family serine peptidase [Bacteroidota bacterium]MDF1868404.1 prolyl oligopeptidase family serine peptidase [Saprospiraceae bacterium]